MYRIILIDDEPLILAGIASLIHWEDYDCTIVGKATNGPNALQMITELRPDIIFTDIRMPVMNGLELIEKCKEAGCDFSFIVLTNLEEFSLAKQALTLGASEYLVKLNLTEDALIKALESAKKSIDQKLANNKTTVLDTLLASNSEELRKTFFQNILSKRFLSSGEPKVTPLDEKEVMTANTLHISKEYQHTFILMLSIRNIEIHFDSTGELTELRGIVKQAGDIISGICKRYFHAYTILDDKNSHFTIICSSKKPENYKEDFQSFCNKINIALKTYFELTAIFGVSKPVDTLGGYPLALYQAEAALDSYYYDSSSSVIFYNNQQIHKSIARDFNINFLKKDLTASIQQNDSVKLKEIFDQIIDLFTTCKPSKAHATSACMNIYTFLYSFFEEKEEYYKDIFPYTINIAEQLSRFNSLQEINAWLASFCAKICKLLDDRKNTKSDKIVDMAKKYISAHYTEKLTLASIADVLNISPGYLSSNFKKFTNSTLSDYIAFVKIEKAKELIDQHEYLMYEISGMLGFENPYYFSKVFKKMTGISPREYESS